MVSLYKVNTAYHICDKRKFKSIEEASRELNRLRALCIRLKRKQTEEISFLLGVSVTDSAYIGKMGYDKPKNKGGKKQFICSERIKKIDRQTGELTKEVPPTKISPHIHILVNGYGASSCSERILENLRKRNTDYSFSKTHLKTAERITQTISYIEKQSTILRQV